MDLDVQIPTLKDELSDLGFMVLAIVSKDGKANYTDGSNADRIKI